MGRAAGGSDPSVIIECTLECAVILTVVVVAVLGVGDDERAAKLALPGRDVSGECWDIAAGDEALEAGNDGSLSGSVTAESGRGWRGRWD